MRRKAYLCRKSASDTTCRPTHCLVGENDTERAEKAFWHRRTRAKTRNNGKTEEKGTADGAGKVAGGGEDPACGECIVKKSESLSRSTGSPTTRDWAEAIHELRQENELELLLKLKGMARSTFYYHLPHLRKPDPYQELRERISAIYAANKGRYGYRRITMQLRNEGEGINHKTVQRLMRQMHLKGKRKNGVRYSPTREPSGKWPPTCWNGTSPPQPRTEVGHGHHRGEDKRQKLYLSPILDLFNGEIIAYATSEHPTLQLVADMLKRAFRKVPARKAWSSTPTKASITSTFSIKPC